MAYTQVNLTVTVWVTNKGDACCTCYKEVQCAPAQRYVSHSVKTEQGTSSNRVTSSAILINYHTTILIIITPY